MPIDTIITIGKAAFDLYMKCEAAKIEFQQLSELCLGVHVALRSLEHSLSEGHLPFTINGVGGAENLERATAPCASTLTDLDAKVKTYRSLSTERKAVWDRVKFAQEDLSRIRSDLTLHVATISAYAQGIRNSSLARIEERLQDLAVAIKRGHKEPSLISLEAVENRDIWDELKSELAQAGITDAEIEQQRLISAREVFLVSMTPYSRSR